MESSPRVKAAVVACAVVLAAGFEGLRTTAYRDSSPAEIWTYCYGETRRGDGTPVQRGDRATPEQCRAMLAERIEGDFLPAVERCITRPMPVKVEGAFVSLAYNIGTGAFCRSSVARKWNAGDLAGACRAMRLYVTAGGKVLRGLVNRRGAESELCLEGIVWAAS